MSESTLRVRYSETDQMGFAYHAHYLVWCEVGRTDFIRELGMSYAELERMELRLAVAEVAVRHLAPARYDDQLVVRTWIERVQSRAVTFAYKVLRRSELRLEPLATAATRLIALDPTGSPRTLPRPLLEAFHKAISHDAGG